MPASKVSKPKAPPPKEYLVRAILRNDELTVVIPGNAHYATPTMGLQLRPTQHVILKVSVGLFEGSRCTYVRIPGATDEERAEYLTWLLSEAAAKALIKNWSPECATETQISTELRAELFSRMRRAAIWQRRS